MTQPAEPNFDRIARPYRWLEYLTLGPALSRCRNQFLPQLAGRNHALVLGDGDGRFLARLLATYPHLRAVAVDISQAMLRLLTNRAGAAHRTSASRLETRHASALDFAPLPGTSYDLVVTHFFLDCFTQADVNLLVSRVRPHLAPGTLWVFSDFRIPAGPLRWPARALIRSLYFAFRVLTGLRTTNLPDHAAALSSVGFTRTAQHLSLGSVLTSELWVLSH